MSNYDTHKSMLVLTACAGAFLLVVGVVGMTVIPWVKAKMNQVQLERERLSEEHTQRLREFIQQAIPGVIQDATNKNANLTTQWLGPRMDAESGIGLGLRSDGVVVWRRWGTNAPLRLPETTVIEGDRHE